MQQSNTQWVWVTSKAINLLKDGSQQMINQYAHDTSFTIKGEEASVDYLVGILHKFGTASGLEINWQKSVAY